MAVGASSSVSGGINALVQEIQKERLSQTRGAADERAASRSDGLKVDVERKVDSRNDSFQAQLQASSASKEKRALDIKIGEDNADARGSVQIDYPQREAPLAAATGRNQRPGSVVDITV